MAANVMVELLKQMQQDLTDQKDYMRNINKKLSNLNDKVDQQQVTLERLEQNVIKNNKLLFGNDETDINIKELSMMLYKPGKEKISKNGDFIHTEDSEKVEELITEEPVEMKDEHVEVGSPVQEETAPIPLSYFNVEQINQFNVGLKQTMSEISEIKESIKDMTTRKTLVDVSSSQMSKEENVHLCPTCLNSEQITQLNGKLKLFMTEMIEIKKFMQETMATKINPVDETESPVGEQETVQISLNYLSTDQISKLNGELKQIAEKYQSTKIVPIVQLIPGPALNHSVMSFLSRGYYCPSKSSSDLPIYKFKLGVNGFKRSVVQDLLAEYPDLNSGDVIEEVLRSRNEWKEYISNYEVNSLNFND